jgi:hypothetical protein
MKITIGTPTSISRVNEKTLIASGKAVRIELLASTGDNFANRLIEFLNKVSALTAQGASRTIGITDGDGDEERAIKLYIDGDGADYFRDIKKV